MTAKVYARAAPPANGVVAVSDPTGERTVSSTLEEIAGALTPDSATVTFTQAGTGAVERSAESKLRETVSVKDFGAVGDGVADDTAAFTAAITASKSLYVPRGRYKITTIDFTQDDADITFDRGAVLVYETATAKAVTISGDNVSVRGISVEGPATFDGTNVQPTYATIWVTGQSVEIEEAELTNVPKVGIFFKDSNNGAVRKSTIVGNYPSGSYTGTETGHVGILIDPWSINEQGSFSISDNNISKCVQGVLVANYAAVSRQHQISVVSNRFRECWDHGVYFTGGTGGLVSSNNFVLCRIPIAMTGRAHVVNGNVMTIGGLTGELYTQLGISMRDPVGCAVTGNVIDGESATASVVVNLFGLSGTIVRDNAVVGNTISCSAGAASAISIGTSNSTDTSANVVMGNTIKAPGVAAQGLIRVLAQADAAASGNIVSGNRIAIMSRSHGIELAQLLNSIVSGNSIELVHDGSEAATVAGIFLNTCKRCDVTGNNVRCSAAWGTNITFRGIWEIGAGSSENRTSDNPIHFDATKLAGSAQFVTVSGSNLRVNEIGAGAPNLNAGVGSIWRRTDGGAATSFYVKESGTDATGWVGK